jgi:hypothetical protein
MGSILENLSRIALIGLAAACLSAATSAPRAEDTVVPRTVIGLYDGAQDRWSNSFLHQMAEMPLNHLGLVLEPWDLRQGLPDLSGRADVRGAVLASEADHMPDPIRFLDWAGALIDSGRRVALIGVAPFMRAADGKYVPRETVNRFLGKLGLRHGGEYVGLTYDSEVARKDSRMVEYERILGPTLPSYEHIRSVGAANRVHLSVRRKGETRSADLVVTGPKGGFVASGYTHYANEQGTFRQWHLNPFAFFAAAFDAGAVPKPDVTTLNGRRIYFSHIDGDGWRNVSEVQPYRRERRLSAEVVLREIIEAYPDLPVTVAPIGADLDPAWCGSEEAVELAREILALPHVEAGSHTYSHPLDWEFFARPEIAEREAPYLPLYRAQCGTDARYARTAAGRMTEIADRVSSRMFGGPKPDPEASDAVDLGSMSDAATMDDPTPRSYAIRPFDLAREVGGSVALVERLLPAGKKVALYQWSGNAMPYRDAIAATRAAGLRNINGGDSRFDREFPTVSRVAPVGRRVGDAWQVYAPNSNENTYTNLWGSRFFGFRYLIGTLENTEQPLRLRPINVYYHMYSGEKIAALAALKEVLDYVREQRVAPIRASRYAAIADGFFSTRIVKTGERAWRFDNRDGLSTIRFDDSDRLEVDFDASAGAIGQTRNRGSLYVALDPAAKVATVALRPRRDTPSGQAYLIDSSWPVEKLAADKGRLAFRAEGFGKGEMRWQAAPRTVWQVRIEGAGRARDVTVQADAEGVFSLDLGFGDGSPLALRMTQTDTGGRS